MSATQAACTGSEVQSLVLSDTSRAAVFKIRLVYKARASTGCRINRRLRQTPSKQARGSCGAAGATEIVLVAVKVTQTKQTTFGAGIMEDKTRLHVTSVGL